MNGMTDMAKSDEEVAKDSSPLMMSENKYPYGLRVTLEDAELDKLNVDISDWEIGDVFPADVLFKLVSKSMNETETGASRKCVCLQITHIGAEIESDQEEEAEDEDEPSLEKHGYLRYK